MMGAVYGATLLDKLGRRKMLLGGLAGGYLSPTPSQIDVQSADVYSCRLIAYCLLTAFTASNIAYGTIVSIYLFGIIFSWGFTPLQTLYAVECLTNRTRAKGSGL